MKDINVREFTAIFMLVSGVGLAIAGFCVEPTGDISDSVIWILPSACYMPAAH